MLFSTIYLFAAIPDGPITTTSGILRLICILVWLASGIALLVLSILRSPVHEKLLKIIESNVPVTFAALFIIFGTFLMLQARYIAGVIEYGVALPPLVLGILKWPKQDMIIPLSTLVLLLSAETLTVATLLWL